MLTHPETIKTNGIRKEEHDSFPLQSVKLSDDMKIKLMTDHFREIMRIMGLDVDEEGLRASPANIARMYIKEMFTGLDPAKKPSISLVEGRERSNRIVIEKNISFNSWCEEYFVPIIGKAHIAYISGKKVISLPQLNQVIQYHSSKPQLQVRLTDEIAAALKEVLHANDIAVIIEAVHISVSTKDLNSTTLTSHYSGKLQNEDKKRELLLTINSK